MKRVALLVMDSFGIGASEDACLYNDAGANTLGHIAEFCFNSSVTFGRQAGLDLPVLSSLGLLHAAKESCGEFPLGMTSDVKIRGAYGYAKEISHGKDTSSGHWEMAGVPVLFDWGYFREKHNSFPPQLLNDLISKADLPGVLGNCHASGTAILETLGELHMSTGKPIVYTSADSVFQVAGHETTFGLDRLLHVCNIARTLLDPYNICRVIARPFLGDSHSNFQRTGNRRDFSIAPPSVTVLDKLIKSGGQVTGIGKIPDIFANQGISNKVHATGITELFNATINEFRSASDRTIVFTNFVDFDSSYGHRRDIAGYAAALEQFDAMLPALMRELMDEDDIMIITADHGCDPSWPGSDHTREHVPLLVFGNQVKAGNLGCRSTFADIAQSLAMFFDLEPMGYGKSFL